MAGGKGTGVSGSSTGIGHPISMNSNDSQNITIIDLISEGPIQGLVQGSASVFLNNDRVIEPSASSQQLSRRAITISLTQNSSTATLNNTTNTQEISLNPEVGGTTRLAIRRGLNTSVVEVDSYHENTQTLKTTSTFFTDSMVTTAADIGGNSDVVPARLMPIPGTSNTPDGLPIEGFVTSRVSGTSATWKTGTYNDSIDYIISSGNYLLELDRLVDISAINGTTVTLSSNWTGSSGNYFFDALGSVNMNANTSQTRAAQRFEGAAVSFRTGTLYQSPLMGHGQTAISKSLDLSMEQTTGFSTVFSGSTETGSQDPRVLLGSGNIGLSSAQLEEVDIVKFRITYPSGFKCVSGRGNDRDAHIRYKLELAIKTPGSSSFDSYILIRPSFTHSGKYVNARTFEHALDLEKFRPFIDFRLRISRIDTANGPGFELPGVVAKYDWQQNTSGSISGTTCILKEKLNHPFTSLASTTFNTKEFTDTPQRSFHVRGKLIRVPSNYVTREESSTGIANYNRSTSSGAIQSTYQDWDGTFRNELVYSNNPAWIYFDIITNKRYGLGDFIKDVEIDKYSLYRIARYCDELVNDGKGGSEPRYTLNTYMTKQADSYKVLKDLATNFLGLLYFLDGKLYPSIDAPASPVYNFTKANVIDGAFTYETTGSKTRVNQVIVSWNNPDTNYALEPLIIEDKRNIATTQSIVTQEAVAYGCTSEAQATRYGRWKLWTAANQREIVSFSTGINGSYICPGDIINVQDFDRYATRYGGRISNTGSISVTVVPLDSPVNLISGSTYDLSVVFIKPSAFALNDMTVNGVNYLAGDLITEAFIDHDSNGSYTLQAIDSEEDAANAKGTATATTPLSLEWKDNIRTETRAVQNSAGSRASLSVSPQFSTTPSPEHIWVLTETKNNLTVQGSAKEYRVLGVSENGKTEYDITAVEHYDSKYSSIEEDFTTYIAEPLAQVVLPTDIVPPVTSVSAKTEVRDEGSAGDNIIISWVAPPGSSYQVTETGGETVTETIDTEYEHLHGFFIEHDFPNYPSPLRVDKNSTIYTFKDIPLGTFTVSVRTMNILENKSVPKTISVTSTDRFMDNLNRMPLGVPFGGTCSTTTSINSSGLFSFKKNVYGFKPPQANSATLKSTSTNTNTYQLDTSGLATITWTSQVEEGSFTFEHHYIVMRSNVTANMLKLLKYNKNPSHGVPYWFDAGNGSETTGLSSLTGTLTASSEGIITGSGTAFTTELQIGCIIVVGSVAAVVSSIESNTVIYIDRSLAVSAGASASTNNYHFDYANDTIISRVYKETNSGYESVSLISLDTTLAQTLERYLYVLVSNGASAPAYNQSAGTFENPAAGAASGWQLAIPSITNNNDIVYGIRRVFTEDGATPQDATWSAPFVFTRRQDGNSALTATLTANQYVIPYSESNSENTTITLTATATNFVSGTNRQYKFFVDNVLKQTTTNTDDSEDFVLNQSDEPATGAQKTVKVQITQGSTTSEDSTSIYGIRDGVDAFTVILTNESHTIAASETGEALTYAGSGTDIRVFHGSTPLTFGTGASTFSVSAATTNITAAGTASTVQFAVANDTRRFGTLPNNAMANADTSGSITFTVTARDPANVATTLTRVQSFTKGNAGASAKVVNLTADKYVIPYNVDDGENTTITFTATAKNITGSKLYKFYIGTSGTPTETTTTAADSKTFVLPDSSEPANGQQETIRIDVEQPSGTIVATDSVSVYGVKDGDDAFTAILTNEAHAIAASFNGTAKSFADSGTDIRVFRGSTPLTVGSSGANTFSVSTAATAITVGTPSTQTFAVSNDTRRFGPATGMANSASKASITFTITARNQEGTGTTLVKVQSFTKGTDGDPAVSGDAGYVVSSAITKNTSGVYSANHLDLDFTFREGGVTTLAKRRYRIARSSNTWATSVTTRDADITDELNVSRLTPTVTVTGQNAVVKVTYSHAGITSIASAPVSIGNDAIGTKTVQLFKKDDSTFSTTTAGTYANPTLNVEAGWTTTQVTPADGEKIYMVSRTFNSDGLNQSNWSAPVIVAQREDGASVTGPAGLRTIQGYLYYEKTTANAPAAPSGNTYYFNTGDVYGGSGATEVLALSVASETNHWTNEPRPQDPTSSNTHYTIRYSGTESSANSSTITVTYSDVVQYTNFDGVVTFSNGTFKEGTTNITTIDGGNISTNTIDAGKLTVGNSSSSSASRLLLLQDSLKIFSGSTLRVHIGNLANTDDGT